MPSLTFMPLSQQWSAKTRLVLELTTPLSCEHAGRRCAYYYSVQNVIVSYVVVVVVVVAYVYFDEVAANNIVAYDLAFCRWKKLTQKELG